MNNSQPPVTALHQPQSRPRAARGRGRGGGPRRAGRRNDTSKQEQQHPKTAPAVLGCCSVCTTGAPNYKCPKCRAIYCSIACCRTHKQDQCGKQPEGATTEKNEKGSQVAAAASKVRSKYVTVTELSKIQGEKRATSKATTHELQPAAKRSRLEKDEQHDNDNDNRYRPYDDLEPGWKMTDEMVSGMRNSSWLRQELADPGLQHLISQVVSTSSRAATGKKGFNHNNRKPSGGAATTPQERLLEELKASNPQFKVFLDKLLVTAGVLEVQEDPGKKGFDLNAWLQCDRGTPQLQLQLQLQPLQRCPRPAPASSLLLPGNEMDNSDNYSNSESEGSSSGDDNSSTSSDDP